MKRVVFEFILTGHRDTAISCPIDIPFTCDNNEIRELAHQILTDNSFGLELLDTCKDPDIVAALTQFIQEQNQLYYDDQNEQLLHNVRNGAIDVDAVIKEKEKLYKEEILEFAERIESNYQWSDKEIFAQSFHHLVHSTDLPELLAKEKGYAKIISDMMRKMNDELEELNNAQQNEMDKQIQELEMSNNSDVAINNLLSRQYHESNYLRQKWESEISSKRGHLYILYRDWITSKISETLMLNSPTTASQPVVGNRSSMFIAQTPALEESFTIHLGSQLKYMHNIRILSADVTDLCSPLHEDESLNGLNIALGLYSSSLSGVVVLTEPGNVMANAKIVRNASLSTDFHFDNVLKQLDQIQTDLDNQTDEEQKMTKLKNGDFFITKHSNLSQSHIIFHLISDENFHSPKDINSRHPVILGLRNILKIACRHDITTITVPALLRHEMSEEMTVNWCTRRSELIFKCAKGFMIESAGWGGAELSTLQLLLPKNISESLFQVLANMVPNIFRVANPKVFQDNISEH